MIVITQFRLCMARPGVFTSPCNCRVSWAGASFYAPILGSPFSALLTSGGGYAKVWRTVHNSTGSEKQRGGLVHTGFYRAWVAKGLDRQVLKHLRVRPPPAAYCSHG